MNVSDQIIQVIEHLAQKFGIAINWSSENIMPIVEELCTKYISYEIMTSKMWLIFGAVLFILIALIGVMTLVEDGVDALILIIFVIPLSIPSVMILSQIHDIIRCTTFPELQILQYIQNFMN